MIPTGTPASTNQRIAPSGELNSIGKLSEPSRLENVPVHALSPPCKNPQSSSSRLAAPGRSPLRLRIII